MAFDLWSPGEWDRAVERSRKKRDKAFWGNPENRWENQDRTPLSIVQDNWIGKNIDCDYRRLED